MHLSAAIPQDLTKSTSPLEAKSKEEPNSFKVSHMILSGNGFKA